MKNVSNDILRHRLQNEGRLSIKQSTEKSVENETKYYVVIRNFQYSAGDVRGKFSSLQRDMVDRVRDTIYCCVDVSVITEVWKALIFDNTNSMPVRYIFRNLSNITSIIMNDFLHRPSVNLSIFKKRPPNVYNSEL